MRPCEDWGVNVLYIRNVYNELHIFGAKVNGAFEFDITVVIRYG